MEEVLVVVQPQDQPGPPENFSDWLRLRCSNPEELFPETRFALFQQYHFEKGSPIEPPTYPDSYEKIPVVGFGVHHFAPHYFSNFEEKKVFVVKPNDLKAAQNPEVVAWNKSQGKFVHAEWDSKNPLNDMAGDVHRSLNIVVETIETLEKMENRKRVFKKVHVACGNQRDEVSLNDNKAILQKVFEKAQLQCYGVKWEKFEEVAQAYYQSLLYLMSNVVANVLPAGFLLDGQQNQICDLVFCLNGDVYLDLYHAQYELRCTKVSTQKGCLKTPFDVPAFIRIPFSHQEKVFSYPLIFCNETVLSLLLAQKKTTLSVSVPAVTLQGRKLAIDEAQESEKQMELSRELSKELEDIGKNAHRVKRAPMQGKHKGKIIGGAAAGSFGFVLIVGLALIPGGQLPAILTAFGFAADAIIAALVALGAGGVASAVSTALTSFIYYLVRKFTPREIAFVELQNFDAKFFDPSPSDVEPDEYLGIETTVDGEDSFFNEDMPSAQAVEIRINEEGFVMIGDELSPPVRRRSLSQTNFFDPKKSLLSAKGKEPDMPTRERSPF